MTASLIARVRRLSYLMAETRIARVIGEEIWNLITLPEKWTRKEARPSTANYGSAEV